MLWTVTFSKRVVRSIDKLPPDIRQRAYALFKRMPQEGPERRELSHFGRLFGKNNLFHGHIKRGHPTYVVVWRLVDRQIRIVEVMYVGTHEGVDSNKIW